MTKDENSLVESYEYAEILNGISSLNAQRYQLIERDAATTAEMREVERQLKRLRRSAERMAVERGVRAVHPDGAKSFPWWKGAAAMSLLSVTVVVFAAFIAQGDKAARTFEPVAVANAAEAAEAPAVAQSPAESRAPYEVSLAVLREYLRAEAPHLSGCAEDLAEHPRWVEALAISKQETAFCTAGVGASYNNCGGIKSRRADRTWRIYGSQCDGLLDIAFLIEREDYAGLAVDRMQSRYCGSGPECEVWSGNIMRTVEDIRANIERAL